MLYSTEPKERRYVKGYGFLSFAKNMCTHATKVAKNLNNKYGQKLVDTAKVKLVDIANLLDDASNQPPKFKTNNWVEINDESRGTYNVNSQIKFKTAMLKSSLCDYSDAYILVKGTHTVNNTAAADADANNTNKKVILKNCAPFTNCISEINNIQVNNAKTLDIVMPMYDLIKYSDNYSKTPGSLWQYCKEVPVIDNNNVIINLT